MKNPLKNKAIPWLASALAFAFAFADINRDGNSNPINRSCKAERPCLACGKPHTHNNSFCSADCCRTYQPKRK